MTNYTRESLPAEGSIDVNILQLLIPGDRLFYEATSKVLTKYLPFLPRESGWYTLLKPPFPSDVENPISTGFVNPQILVEGFSGHSLGYRWFSKYHKEETPQTGQTQ